MTTGIKIISRRRIYNRWVADQTLEDCALRFTARSVRRWSPFRIANTALGATSFLALEAIGGTLSLQYGFANVSAALISTCLIIFALTAPIAYYSARYGLDIDLLTRGAGFGYLGSTVTSLIYASFTFLFFAIEAAIMATALQLCFGLPLLAGYLISVTIVIPLVVRGVTVINRFQAWTQPVWLLLQLAPFVFIAVESVSSVRAWTGFTGLQGASDGSISLGLFGAASAVLFSLVVQIGEQVDFLRFLPDPENRPTLSWWLALIAAGPGWIVVGGLKVLAGAFLAFYALQAGALPLAGPADPTRMYLVVFRQILTRPEWALGVTGLFVILCQLKVNATNTYAGSIAWSNFFSRLTHSHPGRVVWVIFNVLLGLLLVEFGIYRAFTETLGLYAIVGIAWLAAIFADLAICKPLGFSPRSIEFKRAHLYDVNPVGVGAMTIATLMALVAHFGALGTTAQALFPYVALISSLLLVPVLALATRSRFYLARAPTPNVGTHGAMPCIVCEHHFDREDMACCPVYAGSICSLCCSLDMRCGDRCKTGSRLSDQVTALVTAALPDYWARVATSRLGKYAALLTAAASAIGLILAVLYHQAVLSPLPGDALRALIAKLFLALLFVTAVVIWLLLLSGESRELAEEEVGRQTALLVEEIRAHERTDRQLQEAKEKAEAANLAKSKYVTNLSHELRSPLNSILGYAQLLLRQEVAEPIVGRAARTILRSGEHLSGLIEGLLDLSNIEANRLHIYRDRTALLATTRQLVDMFSLQAHEKGIAFKFVQKTPVPAHVFTDEKRLRQILINLISNAIKFTREGGITLSIAYRSEVAVIEVEDTGVGIPVDEQEAIFTAFHRLAPVGGEEAPGGIGLGLTITRLLVEVMGGDLAVASAPGLGSKFTLRLMLPSAPSQQEPELALHSARGFHGEQRQVLVADDDLAQRDLLRTFLGQVGFDVAVAADGVACLQTCEEIEPGLVILDVSMPRLDGWTVARTLRSGKHSRVPIIMISADAGNERLEPANQTLYDAYLIKPFDMDELLDRVGDLLSLDWRGGSAGPDGDDTGHD